MTNFVFVLDKINRFVLEFDIETNDLQCCDEALFYFKNDHEKIFLTNYFLHDGLPRLISLLKKGLSNSIKLLGLDGQDIGYIWNKELHGEEVVIKEDGFWIGSKYSWCSTPGSANPDLHVWLYNDENGEIIIEITPVYRWHFSDPDLDDKSYVTYEEFMKDYKPILFLKVSKHIAEVWLRQAQDLLQIVQTNVARTSAKMGLKIDNENK